MAGMTFPKKYKSLAKIKGKYTQKALQYAVDIVTGKTLSCKYIKQACQRQLDDLLNPKEGFKYFFDVDKAEHVCSFIEKLPHIKGQWVGTNITLEGWQCFILTTTFGWVDESGLRRFKRVYVEVPRKNAKSTLSAGVALYCLACDKEEGAEIYAAATKKEQARIVFDVAKKMVEKRKALQSRVGIKTYAHHVEHPKSNSIFKALARDDGTHDGLNVHCAIIDELHAHKTRDIYDILDTATGSRLQALVWCITTAGSNRAGICYETRADSLKILSGSFHDEELFAMVYTIDEGDDWFDKDTWIKANPNWGISVNEEDIERKANKAARTASALNSFLTKHLDVWVNADVQWMDMMMWDKNVSNKTISDFKGWSCHMGLDLASTTDIAALSILFKDYSSERYYEFHKYYLPEETIEESSNSQYQGWARSGLFQITDGNTIDFGQIERDILELDKEFDIISVGYDPWQSSYLATRLISNGIEMVKFPMSVKNISEPMKELEKLTLEKKYMHHGCPVFTWQISNVVGHYDTNENIKPLKEFPQNKIDGAIAAIIALGRLLASEEDDAQVNDYIASFNK